MATRSFTRGQTKPNVSRTELRRRGGDISQFSEESIRQAVAEGKITLAEQQAAQDKTFEEQANISTYAGSAISTPSGQLTFKTEEQRGQYIREYEKSLARSDRVTGGYSTPEGPVAFVQDRTAYQQRTAGITPEGFRPSGASISAVSPDKPMFSVGERVKSNVLTARQDVGDIFYGFTGRTKRDASGKLQPQRYTQQESTARIGEFGARAGFFAIAPYQSAIFETGVFTTKGERSRIERKELSGDITFSEKAFKTASNPLVIGALTAAGAASFGRFVGTRRIELGEPDIDLQVFPKKPSKIGNDIVQDVEVLAQSKQSRDLILYEGSGPTPYPTPRISVPLPTIKGKASLSGTSTLKKTTEVQEFETEGGKLLLSKEDKRLNLLVKQGEYKLETGLLNKKIIEEGTFTAATQPKGIRFEVSKPKTGPLEGAKVTKFEPGAEIRGIIKPKGRAAGTLQFNPLEDISFKSGKEQPAQEFYSGYLSRTQLGKDYSPLKSGRAFGETFKPEKMIEDLNIKYPSRRAKTKPSDILSLGKSQQQTTLGTKQRTKQSTISGIAGGISKSVLESRSAALPRGIQIKSSPTAIALGIPSRPFPSGRVISGGAVPIERREMRIGTYSPNILKAVSKPNLIIKTKPSERLVFPGQRVSTIQQQLQLQTQTQSQVQLQLQPQLQIQTQLQRQQLSPKTAQFNPLKEPPIFKYPRLIIPPLPIFGSIGEGYLQRGGAGKQVNRYQASLVGLFSGKRVARQPKQLSGLEVRYPVGVSERLPGTRKKTKPLYLLQKGKSNQVIQGIEKQLLLKTRRRG